MTRSVDCRGIVLDVWFVEVAMEPVGSRGRPGSATVGNGTGEGRVDAHGLNRCVQKKPRIAAGRDHVTRRKFPLVGRRAVARWAPWLTPCLVPGAGDLLCRHGESDTLSSVRCLRSVRCPVTGASRVGVRGGRTAHRFKSADENAFPRFPIGAPFPDIHTRLWVLPSP